MKDRIQEIYALEQLSGGNTFVHHLHPAAKLLATAIFIVTVLSFDRYALGRLMPCIVYPVLLMALSETPYAMLLRRFLLALPFCILAGLSNIIFGRDAAFAIGGIIVSYGMISFATILFRAFLCVMAILILVSVTPLSRLTNAMRGLRVPHIFVTMFEMTYRYIGVLFAEAHTMYLAYGLRGVNKKGIEMRDMGSFTGQLLLRAFDRAERVYQAMGCRGYALRGFPRPGGGWEIPDYLFLSAVSSFCALCRFIDINALIAALLGGSF